MQIKKGIPVSPGVAIAKAVVIDSEDLPIPRRTVGPGGVERELERLQVALKASAADIQKLRDQAAVKLGRELARIFDFHLGVVQDRHLVSQIEKMIETERVTAEFSVYAVMREQTRQLRQLDSQMFRERISDIWDIERRIVNHLIGKTRAELGHLRHEAIVVAHDLTPSQTASLDKAKIKAIATDAGGRTSHTAIMAHALSIPAVVGLEDITSLITTGDTVIVDGNKGEVIINPDAAQLMEYRKRLRQLSEIETSLDSLAKLPAVTLDGTEVALMANIEFPDEIQAATDKGAIGIGLYRTEFLFLSSPTEPTEEEQFHVYVQAVKACKGSPLTIRTLDLGADKIWQAAPTDYTERNPFLGCRSIRLCLQNLPLFKTQLRAILRASHYGPLRVMFPLISNIMELRQAKMILQDVMEDLEDQNIPFDRSLAIGIMVEVPSAAMQSKALADEVDFFSIGTNDLIQYTVAVDRSNERIASLYSGGHPAVIQLIKEIVRSANRAKVDVSLCGEMAGEPEFVMLLLGLGLRSLSLTPPAIPEIKRIIRSVTIQQCQRAARKVSAFDSDREVLNYLREELKNVAPEVINERSVVR